MYSKKIGVFRSIDKIGVTILTAVICMIKFIPIMMVAGRLQTNPALKLALDLLIGISLWCYFLNVLPLHIIAELLTASMVVYVYVGYRKFFFPIKSLDAHSVWCVADQPSVIIRFTIRGDPEKQLFTLAKKATNIRFVYLVTCFVYLSMASSLSHFAKQNQRGS